MKKCHAYSFVKKDKQLLLTEIDEILILCNLFATMFLLYLLSILLFVLFSIFFTWLFNSSLILPETVSEEALDGVLPGLLFALELYFGLGSCLLSLL